MAINHQEPDRPPIQYYATPEVSRLLTDYFNGQDLKEVFELDFRVVNYPWPSPDDFDYSVIPEQSKHNKGFTIVLGNAGIPDIINGTGVRGRGMGQLLIDIALQDEVGIGIIDRRVNFWYEYLRKGLEAGQGKIDIIHLGEDLGSQKGILLGP